ncbi:MAG: aminotransferase class I/II-fold pyridoxal phosphate-dependent enzyme, partial [Cyanobacteria bacterium J06598_3]
YVVPQGAFYLMVDISQVGLDSVTFCQKLLEEKHVATIPGIAFGAEGTLRVSYATDLDTIERGMERLSGFVRANS